MLIKKSKYLFIPTMLPYILKKKSNFLYYAIFQKRKTEPILFFQPLFLKCYFKKTEISKISSQASSYLLKNKKQKMYS